MTYADDTVLLAETEEDLREILNEVNRIGKTFDMKMNAKKTKTMLVSKDATLTKVSLKIDGDIIKQTDNYTYLGQTITSNGKCNDEILKRIEIARGAFNSMLKSITARHISMKTRKRILKACVVDAFIRMWNVDNNHQKYDKIAIVWNVGISEDDENTLEGKQNKWRSPNTGRRTALHNFNNKEKKNYLRWSHYQT